MELAEISLRKYLNELLDKMNYKTRDVVIKPITSGGANYTSGLFKITVTSPDKEKLHLFSKVAIAGEQLKEALTLEDLFRHERFVYEDLQKAYDNLQIKYGIPEKDRFKFAKYYGCTLEPNREVFIFEDLNEKGFQIYDRFDTLKWDHVSENIKVLAKFHALSFVLEKEMPELFERIRTFKFPVEMMAELFSKPVDIFLEGLSEYHKTKVIMFIEDKGGLRSAVDMYVPFGRDIVIHSDYRPSNIMYKQEGADMTVLPVDYQTVRVGCAASDLVYYVMTATGDRFLTVERSKVNLQATSDFNFERPTVKNCPPDGDFRKAHHHELLELYYSQLGLRLAEMEVDVGEVYPREQFDLEIKKMLPLSLLFALAMYPVLTVPPEAAPRVDGAEADLDNFRVPPNQLSVTRLEGLIEDFIRWGLL